eukprot:COSAG02_NODE_2106_length_9814_cov_3.447864_6_plen_79_part_00
MEASKVAIVKLVAQEKKGEKAKLKGALKSASSSLLVVSGTVGNIMKPSVHLSHPSSVAVALSILSSPCRSASFSVAVR